MKNFKVAILTTISLCNAFPSCYMQLTQIDNLHALLTIESTTKSPKHQQVTYVCSCPVCQKNAQSQNEHAMDYETQVVLSNFSNIVGNFISIVQDPNNKEHVGKQVTSLIGSVITIAQQVVKRSVSNDQLFTIPLEHFQHGSSLNKCSESTYAIIELINSLLQLAIEFIADNPELSLLETQWRLEVHANNFIDAEAKSRDPILD